MFTLAEALEAVKNKPEFGVYERPFGTVIDYNLTTNTTFVGNDARHTQILRNLRGTCFDHSGKIIRLAFHKFENLGQSEDFMPEKFDFSAEHRIEQKLDGSMITPIPMPDGGFRLGTRAGVTDVANMAERFLESMPVLKCGAYVEFMRTCILNGVTPIFEFCSRENRVVIDHPESKLVLLDMRHHGSGNYFRLIDPDPLIDRVKIVATEHSNISKFAEYVKTLKDDEGVVVKFAGGNYVKIKADEYCLRHRTLDGLRFEKDVLKMVLTNVLDDVLPMVDAGTADRLRRYNSSVIDHIANAHVLLAKEFATVREIAVKKDFAEAVKNSKFRAALFKMFDGKAFGFVDFAIGKCGSSSDVESIRWLIGPSYYDFK